jgi:protein-disulfide isomerase
MRIVLALVLAAAPAVAQEQKQLSEEQARRIVPRADLTGLTDAQRGVFVDAATELYVYAGCQDTLAKCLGANEKDPHAVRMALLVRHLVSDGAPASQVVQAVERYYDAFSQRNRAPVSAENCPTLGKGEVAIVEFSDYQCPHCAAALQPLEQVVEKDRKGRVFLCSKYFPFPSHPRARIAALCAEYARAKGKFWQTNAVLFSHQDALEDSDLKAYARELGLDGDEMLKKAYAGEFDAAVEKNIREGTAAGVDSTPAIFVDGRRVTLPARPFYLQFAVDDELSWDKDRVWNPTAGHKVAKTR